MLIFERLSVDAEFQSFTSCHQLRMTVMTLGFNSVLDLVRFKVLISFL